MVMHMMSLDALELKFRNLRLASVKQPYMWLCNRLVSLDLVSLRMSKLCIITNSQKLTQVCLCNFGNVIYNVNYTMNDP